MRSNGRGIRKVLKRPEDALNNVLTLLDLNTTAYVLFVNISHQTKLYSTRRYLPLPVSYDSHHFIVIPWLYGAIWLHNVHSHKMIVNGNSWKSYQHIYFLCSSVCCCAVTHHRVLCVGYEWSSAGHSPSLSSHRGCRSCGRQIHTLGRTFVGRPRGTRTLARRSWPRTLPHVRTPYPSRGSVCWALRSRPPKRQRAKSEGATMNRLGGKNIKWRLERGLGLERA